VLETFLPTVVVDGSPNGHRRILAMAFFFADDLGQNADQVQSICTLWTMNAGLFDDI
jgi:hypothetical protein